MNKKIISKYWHYIVSKNSEKMRVFRYEAVLWSNRGYKLIDCL